MTLTEASFQHRLWPIVIKGLSFLSRGTTTPLPACDTPSSNPAGPACHSWMLNHFCKLPSMMLSNLKLASSSWVGSEGHISLVAVLHSTVGNIWKLHSRETAPCVCGTGCLWTTHSERKPTKKSATDITQPHTFEGKTLKSIKQTTMSPFFLSAERHKCYCTMVFQHPFSHCDTITRIFPRMTSLFHGAGTAISNHDCPTSAVLLEDKESVLLRYLEEKTFW